MCQESEKQNGQRAFWIHNVFSLWDGNFIYLKQNPSFIESLFLSMRFCSGCDDIQSLWNLPQLWQNRMWVTWQAKLPPAFWDSPWTGHFDVLETINSPKPHTTTNYDTEGFKKKKKVKLKAKTQRIRWATLSTLRHNPFQGYFMSYVLKSWGWERSGRGADETLNNTWLLSTTASPSSR